jgi:hypothetical protein
MLSFLSTRVISWAVVGALLTGVIALPLWQGDGLFLDQLFVFFLPACQFELPILALSFWLLELQASLQVFQGAASKHSPRAPPLLARV